MLAQYRNSTVSIESDFIQFKDPPMLNRLSLTSIIEDEESSLPMNSINLNTLENRSIVNMLDSNHISVALSKEVLQSHLPNLDSSASFMKTFKHNQAPPATKGTQFQSNLKYKENIEADEQESGTPSEFMTTQPVNKSLQLNKNGKEIKLSEIAAEFREEGQRLQTQGNEEDKLDQYIHSQFSSQVRRNDESESNEDLEEGHIHSLMTDGAYTDSMIHPHPNLGKSSKGNFYYYDEVSQQNSGLKMSVSDMKKITYQQIVETVMAKDKEFQPKAKRKNFRIFEQFYVIGCDQEELELFEPAGDDLDRASYSDKDGPLLQSVPSALVYQYPEKAEMDQVRKRADVIKDFAFPNGIKPKLMKLDTEAETEETKSNLVTLMLEIQKNRKNSFVFTLDSRNESMEDGIDNYFNCLCIKFDTLAKRKTDGTIF